MKHKIVITFLLMGIVVLSQASNVVAQTLSDGNITEIVSDNTWRSTNREEAWWHSVGFDDSGWINTASPSSGTCGQNVTLNPSIAQPMWDLTPVVGGHAYFRKKFSLKEKPEKAIIKTVFDDDGDIYINSNLVRQDRSGSVNPEPFVDDITQLLNVGDNVVGLYVVDTVGGCQSAQVRVDLTISYDDAVLNIPLTKQDDTQWQSDTYAGGSKDKLICGDNLKSCGCAVTSLSMVMNYLGSIKAPNGRSTTPQTINEYFKENQSCSEFGCVSTGYVYGAVRWAAADQYSREASRNFGTNTIQLVNRSETNTNEIRKSIESGNPVILQSPDKQHWFVGYGVSQNNILIRDPFYERYSLDQTPYLNNVAAMIKYKEAGLDRASLQVYGAPGEQILVQDESGRKTGYDAVNKVIIVEIPDSTYYFEPHAGRAHQDLEPADKNEHNSGVWVVDIKTPDNGSFKVDVTTESDKTHFEYVVYGTDVSGDVNHKIGVGKIANQGEFESEFSFISNPQNPGEMLKLENNKGNKEKKEAKIIIAKKVGNKKAKIENSKIKAKPNIKPLAKIYSHRYWPIKSSIVLYVGSARSLLKNIFVVGRT